MRSVSTTTVGTNNMFYSYGDSDKGSYVVRPQVSLSVDTKLTYNETDKVWELS